MSVLPVGIGNAGGEYTLDNSLRLRSSASAYLSRTFSTPTNNKKWTWSAWVKRGILSTTAYSIFGQYTNNTNRSDLYFDANDNLNFYNYVSGTVSPSPQLITNQAFRDPSAWYHIVLVWDSDNATGADRQIIYVNGTRITSYKSSATVALGQSSQINSATGHTIGEFEDVNVNFDGYMTEINFIDGQALDPTDFGETDATTGVWKPKAYSGTYGTNGFYLPTTATTQAEGFNTVLYTGTGAVQTIDDMGFAPDLVWIKNRSEAYNHILCDTVRGSGTYLSSSTTDADAIAGSVVTAFTPTGYEIGAIFGANKSGNNIVAWGWDAGANQTSTGISSVPYTGAGAARQVTGFGFSPDLILLKNLAAASPLLIDSVRGPFFELQTNSAGAETSNSGTRFASIDADGFSFANTAVGGLNAAGNEYIAWGWDAGDGDPVTNTQGDINSTVKANDATGVSVVTWTSSGTADDRVGHGLNSAPEVIIYKSRSTTGEWYVWTTAIDGSNDSLKLNSTDASTAISGTYTSPTATTISNYGYAASTTLVAYCFKSVSGVSDIGTYTGTGTTTGEVVTTGFRPGFVMVKNVDSGSTDWYIWDSTRDPFLSGGDTLRPNLADAQTSGNYIEFTDTGFQLKEVSASYNASGDTYLYMAFKGSYSDYVSPLNDTGTIDSRVKANTAKGFSIVSYTGNATAGATVGHGLSSAPKVIITKVRSSAGDNWAVYHESVGNTGILLLNGTNATVTNSIYWNNTSPTSSVFTVGSANQMNRSGADIIAYCWAEVAGYSKFGSYTGTGTSGKAVTGLGFQPAFLMVKRTDAAEGWQMLDNTRNPVAPHNSLLEANQPNAEITNSSRNTTFDSDGFTINNTSNAMNASGGTYIYMAFADTRDAQFNFDASGNKNNWTPNNINSNASSETSYDIMTDVPTLTDENTANYCTWNPVDIYTSSYIPTYSDGNLKVYHGTRTYAWSTLGMSEGKWYAEIELDTHGSGIPTIGIALRNSGWTLKYTTYASNGNKIVNGTSTSYGSTYTAGDIIGIAFDADTGDVTFYKNNVSQGSISNSDLASNVAARIWTGHSGSTAANATWILNAGQRPFAYTPPTGFLPMNTYNLVDSTIDDGSKQFNTVLYTGNGSTQSITGVNFQPDAVWIKSRSQVTNHGLHDALRLTAGGNPAIIYPNSTAVESSGGRWLNTLDSDGFTLNANTSGNNSGSSYVAWNWKANGSGVSNTVGDTNATASANTTSGFSIVSFNAGAAGNHTVGHGLGITPEMIIMKDRDSSGYGNWTVFHSAVCTSTSNYLLLNGTGALGSVANSWGSALPTSTVFGFGSNVNVGANDNIISYCFAPVEGFSSFGKYTGNGSADGPFIYTGFSPSWLLIKRSDAAANWLLYDNKRVGYNPNGYYLLPDGTWVEGTGADNRFDLTSNGFKVRDSNQSLNVSGGTYIYAAFAENPFKNALAR